MTNIQNLIYLTMDPKASLKHCSIVDCKIKMKQHKQQSLKVAQEQLKYRRGSAILQKSPFFSPPKRQKTPNYKGCQSHVEEHALLSA